MNVVILSASRKVGLVRAFQAALAATGGGRVFALDVDPCAAALQAADAGHRSPRSDDPGYLNWLFDWCRREAVTLVVPTRDEELPVLAPAAPVFLNEGRRVVVGSAAAIADCQDKRLFAARCAELGFLTPREIAEPLAPAAFPAFVKPRFGKAGHGTARVASPAALSARGFDPATEILQEYVDDPEYTIDVFVDWEGRAISAVPRERVRIVAGESVVSRTVRDDELAAAAVNLVLGLGLRGPATVQAFRAPGRICFIEVNPRFGGAAALSFAAGCPSPEWLVRLARGETVEPRVGQHAVGLWMFRHSADLFLNATEVRACVR